MKHDLAAAVAAIVGGSVMGAGSATVVAILYAAPSEVVTSLYVKSITTPVAVLVIEPLGGIPAISAAVVIVTGLFVAMFGPYVLKKCGVDDDVIVGVAMGTSGHALGMAEAIRRSEMMGAAAAFAMVANGLMTAIVLSLVL